MTPRSAVLWSGGKDSNVLLHLCRRVQPEMLVITFEIVPHPTKNQFLMEQMQHYPVRQVRPYARDICAAPDGSVQLIGMYAPGWEIFYPIEAHPSAEPTARSLCALDWLRFPTERHKWRKTILSRAVNRIFIGHRGDDTCPAWGDVAASKSVVERRAGKAVYPLLDWTEADIWEYSRVHGVAQNEARYQGDLAQNNDYADICGNCLRPDGRATAYCPHACTYIPNIAERADVTRRRAAYQFINLKRSSDESN